MSESASRWRERAACGGSDPELFFPVTETGPATIQVGEAKRICDACQVQAACLSWAFQHGLTDGIWGGRVEKERRAMIHQQRLVPAQPTRLAAREWQEQRGQRRAEGTA